MREKFLRIAVLSLFVVLKHVPNVLGAMGSSFYVLMCCDGCWRFLLCPFCLIQGSHKESGHNFWPKKLWIVISVIN